MEYRKLGSSGLNVSVIGLGSNTFGVTADEAGSIEVIETAIENGVNYIDTADVYGVGSSETIVGKAIKGKRHDLVIGTKVGISMSETPNDAGLSRSHIMTGVENSLRRLGTDYIDLYQAHTFDESTPIEETLRAFDDLVRQGKVRYIGCSNWTAWQLAWGFTAQQKAGLAPFTSVQPEWNFVNGLQDPHLQPACRQFGVGIIPYMPLAAGALTGKYTKGQAPPPGTRLGDRPRTRRILGDRLFDLIEVLTPWAEARGHTLPELAIAWLIAQPEVGTVIVGARRAPQVLENLKAADWVITPEERDEVAALVDTV
jgi:aryl-alcohol dehydrogenase-like predicted oxidoreductase